VSSDLFLSLDFIYLPAKDFDTILSFYVDVLGARLISKVRAMGTVVAEVGLAESGPRLILAEHLHGEAPVLIYRVADMKSARKTLRAQGLRQGEAIEIPHGPCYRFDSPGGHRFAIYHLERPEADQHFAGRNDP
jgi:catechol 2,3-dioxygenase-like lactoylglutathione lyase family enzyme